jgi:hypothetical protein
MKFMERERKLAIILQKKIYMYAKTKNQKANFKEDTEDRVEQKSFSDKEKVSLLLNFRKEA